jgi:hypothetical protein
MRKNKKHKWKYQINIKKKIIVLIILGVFLVVGLGYAIIESSLGIGGTLEVSKYSKKLYNVIKRETAIGYGAKYTGNHQDSMDSTKSIEDIYYFYALNATKGNEVLNKNNVVFANHCWQMIRTTDTGGVKLLYNGEPEEIEVDGETRFNCGDTRNLYHMGTIKTTLDLNGTAIYAKNYTVSTSGTTTTFTLVDDPDDPDDYKAITVNSTDATTQIADITTNYPYVCGNKTGTCTNQDFYKVESQSSGTTANAYQSTYRDTIGLSEYNEQANSLAYAGYMYGDVYTYQSSLWPAEQDLTITQTMLSETSAYPTFKYSKTINSTGSGYVLNNPILGSDITDPDYSGYYTYRNTFVSGAQPFYLVGRKGTGTNYYFVKLSSTKTLADFSIMAGTDIVDNGDNTYTIKNGTNQAIEVTPRDWYADYANYVGYYTCGDTNNTCASPRYITATSITDYTYINASESITISTERTGLELSGDVKTITLKQWYDGYNTTYSNYLYTCGNTDTTCTEANLRYIRAKTATNYRYIPNQYFGASVKYENNVYKLQNEISLENAANMTNLSTHHYTCVTPGEKECTQVAYIYFYDDYDNMNYIILNDENVTSAQDALDAMFTKNTTNSTIKTNVDAWYEMKLLNTVFESKLDDTIYCNDRSYPTLSGYTFNESGWNDNGGNLNQTLYFKESLYTQDLTCTNITDRFSISNDNAKLTYKIALLSAPEVNLMGHRNAIKTDYSYWLASPCHIHNDSYGFYVYNNGNLVFNYGDVPYGVRPTISLITGTKYSQGNGSMTNPYIVDMSN